MCVRGRERERERVADSAESPGVSERGRVRVRVRGDRSFCARLLISLLSLACTHHLHPHPRPERPLTRSRWSPPRSFPSIIGIITVVVVVLSRQTTHTLLLLSRQSFFSHLGREVVDHDVRSIRWPTASKSTCFSRRCTHHSHPPAARRTIPLKHSTPPETPVVTFRRVSRAAIGIPLTDRDFDARQGKPAVTHRDARPRLRVTATLVIAGERHRHLGRRPQASAVARSEGDRPTGSRDFLV